MGRPRQDNRKRYQATRTARSSKKSRSSSASSSHRRRKPPPSQRNQQRATLLLPAIQASVHSIHKDWKKKLGGLIRWYVNHQGQDVDPNVAMQQVERMYLTAGGWSVAQTRDLLLQAMGSQKEETEEWIDVQMVVEHNNDGGNITQPTKLDSIQRPGEGPTRAGEVWNTCVVSPEMVHRSYFVEVTNRSAVDLSCEMTIDGRQVAWNAPIPANSKRTVKPESRYFGSYQWILQPSQRIPLHEYKPKTTPTRQIITNSRRTHPQPSSSSSHQRNKNSQRYNGKRPDYSQGPPRVSLVDYPDACEYGWTFTGSGVVAAAAAASRVEFYEKKMNIGIVFLDFFDTTATVKTVLDHPTTGINQLFRKGMASSDMYRQILENPRFHTTVGYQRRQQGMPQMILPNNTATTIMEEETAMEDDPEDRTDDDTTDEALLGDSVYFAKNEGYNFKFEGHKNRDEEMKRLEPLQEFQAWEQASSEEWACIHCKFYVAQAKPTRFRSTRENQTQRSPEKLPEMKPVVNIKATEKAVLSTKFHQSQTTEAKRSSNVRMSRVSLNDRREWGAGAVFEYKLYYRAESDAIATQDRETEDDQFVEMDEAEEEPLVSQKLLDRVPLSAYKTEKLQQLIQLHRENKCEDRDEGDAVWNHCMNQIYQSEDSASVDDVMKNYWDWNQKQQWAGTRS